MVLFITRKYPPNVGGMENFSAGLAKALGNQFVVLALRYSQVHLLWWLPLTLLRAIWISRKVDSIHIGDGVLAWLGIILRQITRKPVSITVHGLDLTYSKFGYQKYIWSALKRFTTIIAVSKNTENILTEHGIAKSCSTVIPNGVDIEYWNFPHSKIPLANILPDTLPDSPFVIITVGRLIQRKGVAWFVEQIMALLPKRVVYVIVGSGPEQERIQKTIDQLGLHKQVYMVGRVNETVLKHIYGAADIFVMPNIEISNDVEGFGIVAIEAGACGLPVLAANVEGMQDILVDGSTGFLVESASTTAWKQAISGVLDQVPLNSERIKSLTAQRFSWEKVAAQYQEIFKTLSK